MKYSTTTIASIVVGLIGLAVAGVVIYEVGVSRGRETTLIGPNGNSSVQQTAGGAFLRAGDIDPATGKKILYWHDPMVPAQRFDQPGKSPFMNMQLVPVYENGGEGAGRVTVSSRVQQNLGIRTAEVSRRLIMPRIEAAGSISFNEREQAIVQTRATAYVESLHVRATFDRVAKGQALVDLYVPEWVAAQEEFLSVRRFNGTDLASLVDAAKQRLRQVGMTDDEIRSVESRGTVQPRTTLVAPLAGVVAELAVREGMTVMAGATLFRINGLGTVWVNAAVPESQAALLRPGAAAKARSPALPGSEFAGTVQAILPDVDVATRTIRARIELDNRDQTLAPGMFVNVALETAATDGLVVPSEAVIRTGTRTVVIVAEGAEQFHPTDVEIGADTDGATEIKRGLTAGQSVVVSGQFLIDSEASLRATSTRMQGAPASDPTTREHAGEGKITAIGDGTVTLSHGPIPSIQWGAMTMQFVLPPVPPSDLQVNEEVRFSFTMGSDGKPRLIRIEPLERRK